MKKFLVILVALICFTITANAARKNVYCNDKYIGYVDVYFGSGGILYIETSQNCKQAVTVCFKVTGVVEQCVTVGGYGDSRQISGYSSYADVVITSVRGCPLLTNTLLCIY